MLGLVLSLPSVVKALLNRQGDDGSDHQTEILRMRLLHRVMAEIFSPPPSSIKGVETPRQSLALLLVQPTWGPLRYLKWG